MDDDTADGQALTFAMSDAGLLVVGNPHAVAAYTQGLRRCAAELGEPLSVSDVADIAAASAAVTSVAASTGSYVEFSQRSLELLSHHQLIPGQTSGFFQGGGARRPWTVRWGRLASLRRKRPLGDEDDKPLGAREGLS